MSYVRKSTSPPIEAVPISDIVFDEPNTWPHWLLAHLVRNGMGKSHVEAACLSDPTKDFRLVLEDGDLRIYSAAEFAGQFEAAP